MFSVSSDTITLLYTLPFLQSFRMFYGLSLRAKSAFLFGSYPAQSSCPFNDARKRTSRTERVGPISSTNFFIFVFFFPLTCEVTVATTLLKAVLFSHNEST